MPKYLQRMGGLFALFFVQFQAAAQGSLPLPAGIPSTVQEWAIFAAYFTAALLMHVPMLRRYFRSSSKPVEKSSSEENSLEPLP